MLQHYWNSCETVPQNGSNYEPFYGKRPIVKHNNVHNMPMSIVGCGNNTTNDNYPKNRNSGFQIPSSSNLFIKNILADNNQRGKISTIQMVLQIPGIFYNYTSVRITRQHN